MDSHRRRPNPEETARSGVELSAAEEQQLLDLARRGDTGAYGRLVRAYQDLIYALVHRSVRDRAVAEELTQDVFIKAFRSLGTFRGESRFSTWLYRIAVNLCHDQRESLSARNRSRETSLEELEPAPADSAAPAGQPDQVLEASEMASSFQTGLDLLEPKYRDAFLLRHGEDRSYEEISEILGITVSNAKVRVHRAREMLLDVLRARGFEV
ncbi:MAG TPA: RNA polymerase sigma factor [Candidatus Eisenbacteria bacterium]|nr:RNA polymerase sigma factor [Candidatus Eisenbacteria bacterium]